MTAWNRQVRCRRAAARRLPMLMTLGAVIVPLFAASPARALDTLDCGTQEDVSGSLRDEKHTLVAGMESFVIDPDSGRPSYIVRLLTATADRKTWYLISGDAPLGARSAQYCVTLKGRDLKIADYREDGALTIPQPEFDRAEAERDCGAIRAREGTPVACGVRADMVSGLKQTQGERLVLQGQVVSRKGAPKGLLGIVADPGNERDYRRLFTRKSGATTVLGYGRNFFLSDAVIAALDGGT